MNNIRHIECLDVNICPVCGKSAYVTISKNRFCLDVSCDFCGFYQITRALIDDDFVCLDGKYDLTKLAAYLRENKSRKNDVLLCQETIEDNGFRVSPRDIDIWYNDTKNK